MYFKGLTIGYRNPDFKSLKWILKARGKNISQKVLENICFDGQNWAATDGHRLHILDALTNIYEKGLYKIIAESRSQIILEKTDQEIIKYPEYEDLLAHKNIDRLPDLILNEFVTDINYTQLIRLLPTNITIQLKFFQDMMYLGIPWKVYLVEDDKTIFNSDEHVGIIMNIRM